MVFDGATILAASYVLCDSKTQRAKSNSTIKRWHDYTSFSIPIQ